MFNIKKIMYAAFSIITTVVLAVAVHWIFIFLLIPLFIIPISIKKEREKERKKVQVQEFDDRTIILSERDKMTVCFSDVFGNENDICIAEHESKYIGRDKKTCSLYIGNSAVGRKHAKITFSDGKLKLLDNDSLNNTYINNMKLKKNKQYEMNDGDKVIFANEEYMIFIKDKTEKKDSLLFG